MKSSIFALIVLGLVLTVVQCKDKTFVTEYEIKQGKDNYHFQLFYLFY